MKKDCNTKAVSTEQHQKELLCDTFINGILSSLICLHLLENKTLNLETAYNLTYSLDLVQRDIDSYLLFDVQVAVMVILEVEASDSTKRVYLSYYNKKKCFFCEEIFHVRYRCPVCDIICYPGKKGTFFQSKLNKIISVYDCCSTNTIYLFSISSNSSLLLSHAATEVTANVHRLIALIHSCSTDSFINEIIVKKLNLDIYLTGKKIS